MDMLLGIVFGAGIEALISTLYLRKNYIIQKKERSQFMFDVALDFLTQFVSYIPLIVCLILVFNIISDLLWGGK